MLKHILFWAAVCLVRFGYTQQNDEGKASYTLYNETYQLFRSSINDIRRDAHGFFWLATERGLIRYDGRNFIEVVPESDAYRRQEIDKLSIRGDTLFIVYREHGCLALDVATLRFTTLTDARVDDAIGISGAGIVLLNTDGTLMKWRGTQMLAENKYPRPRQGILLFQLGRLFVSLPGMGAFELDTARLDIRRKLPVNPEAYKESFSVSGRDVFFVSNGRAVHLDETLSQLRDSSFGLTLGKQISAMAGAHSGQHFLICNNNILFEYRNGGFRQIKLPGLENFEFRNLWVQDSANLLLGTNQGLVHVRLGQHPTEHIQESGDGSNGELRIRRKILQRADGSLILMGSPLTFLQRPGGGLERLMPFRISAYDATFAGKDMYVATEGLGLVRIGQPGKSAEMLNIEPAKPKTFYLSVWYDALRSRLLVGGQQTLICYDPSTRATLPISVAPGFGMVRSIKQDRLMHHYWIGTDNGVFVLDTGMRKVGTFTRAVGGLRGARVGDILHRQNTEEIWIGHDHGVDVVDMRKMRIVRSLLDSIYINPRVVSLEEDDHGRVWMGTYAGIVAFDPLTGHFNRLSRSNGLINSEYNYKASLHLQDGRLIFGGLNGYDIIDPSKFPFQSKVLKGMVTGFHRFINNDTIFQAFTGKPETISFDTENEYLRIYLSSPDILDAAGQTYEYTINGGQWITLNGAAYINILRLDPGQYTLNIRAFDAYGSQVRFDPVQIRATVPFLKSRLFLIILICFVLLFMTLFILSSVKAKTSEMHLKERIAMDLHDEVGTMLTRALYVARTNDRSGGDSHLVHYLNESLFSLRAYINTMNSTSFRFGALADDVKEMTQSLLGMTHCRGVVDEKTDSDYRIKGEICRDIRLCLYEIINNTLKHSAAGSLRIYITARHGVLTVFTRDNGTLRSIDDLGTQGNGLRNLRKRVSKHAGSIEFGIPRAGHGLTVRMQFVIR